MRGGSRLATAMAARRRCSRSDCSGHTSVSSQARSAASATSTGCRSRPSRHATRGCAAGNGVARIGAAGKHRCIRRRRRQSPIPIVVAVAIGQQAQTGRGTHFEQRQRLRQARQHRQQRGAAAGLIGLRAACQHRRAHGSARVAQHACETPASRVACRTRGAAPRTAGWAGASRPAARRGIRARTHRAATPRAQRLVERRATVRLDLGKSPEARCELFAQGAVFSRARRSASFSVPGVVAAGGVLGQLLGERAHQVGARDDADQLAVAQHRDPLDVPVRTSGAPPRAPGVSSVTVMAPGDMTDLHLAVLLADAFQECRREVDRLRPACPASAPAARCSPRASAPGRLR